MDQLKNDAHWKSKLSPEQYKILRQKGTEAPFSGHHLENKKDGSYHCAACGQLLFESGTKFDSGSGWPSFTDPVNTSHVELREDTSLGMLRSEVTCSKCGSHLGHVFPDGPKDRGGQRYCINSVCLDFKPKEGK